MDSDDVTGPAKGIDMTVQLPAARHDDLALQLAARIERRLTVLADELEHAGVVVYDGDRGLATRGEVVRMSVADLAAIVADVALDASAVDTALGRVAGQATGMRAGAPPFRVGGEGPRWEGGQGPGGPAAAS